MDSPVANYAASIAQAAAADNHAQGQTLPAVVGRVLHIDGDYMAYFCAGNDDMPAGVSRQVADGRIRKMQAACGAERVVMHLTADWSDKGKRYAIATVKPYQGNRSGKSKPKNWAVLREFLQHASCADEVRLWVDREADDGIALAAATAVGLRQYNPIVIGTTDKDMRMLPGLHLDWSTFDLTLVEPRAYSVIGNNGLQYGYKWFCLQMLQGDSTDNIPGLEAYHNHKGNPTKVGDKTAVKLLEGINDGHAAIEVVASYYADYYQATWQERFVEQAALLWMRCDGQANPRDFMSRVPHDLFMMLDDACCVLGRRLYAQTQGQ